MATGCEVKDLVGNKFYWTDNSLRQVREINMVSARRHENFVFPNNGHKPGTLETLSGKLEKINVIGMKTMKEFPSQSLKSFWRYLDSTCQLT